MPISMAFEEVKPRYQTRKKPPQLNARRSSALKNNKSNKRNGQGSVQNTIEHLPQRRIVNQNHFNSRRSSATKFLPPTSNNINNGTHKRIRSYLNVNYSGDASLQRSNQGSRSSSRKRQRLINSLQSSYVTDRSKPHMHLRKGSNGRKKISMDSSYISSKRDSSEMVMFDSVLNNKTNRKSKHSRRITYDNGQPLALTDLCMLKFPSGQMKKDKSSINRRLERINYRDTSEDKP